MTITALQQGWQKIRAHRHLLVAATTAVSVLGAGAVVIAGADNGYDTRKNLLLAGAAWLPSRAGTVTLIDGNTATVAAQAQVTQEKADLDVVQQAQNTYVVDHLTNTIYRIDGAYQNAIALTTQPFAKRVANLALFAGPEQLYAVDSENHFVVQLIPETPKSQRGPQFLSAATDLDNIVVDREGTLWAYAPERGELSSVADGELPETPVTKARGGRLVLTNGQAVLVDSANKSATILTTKNGPADPIKLNLPDTDVRSIGVSAHTNRIYVTTATTVTICDLTLHRCQPEILVPKANLNTPVEAEENILVPDNQTGKVAIINLATNSLKRTVSVLNKPEDFHLLAHEGHVFFNNPTTNQAGVIRPNGDVIRIGKDTLTYPRTVPPSPPTKPPPTTPPTAPPSTSLVPPPPPTTAPPTTSPPPVSVPPTSQPPLVFSITADSTTVKAGQSVLLSVEDIQDHPSLKEVTWDFGDGKEGRKTSVSHSWETNGKYTVKATGKFEGGEEQNASIRIIVKPMTTLTVTPPTNGTITGPGIKCGQPKGAERACEGSYNDRREVTLTAAPGSGSFLESWTGSCDKQTDATCTVRMEKSHTVGATFRPGIRLMPLTTKAAWSSGAGDLPGNGGDRDEIDTPYGSASGYAVTYKKDSATLQDGKRPAFLETHPERKDGGWIQGSFPLNNIQFESDVHFWADFGFIKRSTNLGDATFSVTAILKDDFDITTEKPLGSRTRSASSTDPNTFKIPIDRGTANQVTEIRLKVVVNGSPTDDCCVWVDPRIEG